MAETAGAGRGRARHAASTGGPTNPAEIAAIPKRSDAGVTAARLAWGFCAADENVAARRETAHRRRQRLAPAANGAEWQRGRSQPIRLKDRREKGRAAPALVAPELRPMERLAIEPLHAVHGRAPNRRKSRCKHDHGAGPQPPPRAEEGGDFRADVAAKRRIEFLVEQTFLRALEGSNQALRLLARVSASIAITSASPPPAGARSATRVVARSRRRRHHSRSRRSDRRRRSASPRRAMVKRAHHVRSSRGAL
jgi:hypothetical protein